MLLNGLMCNGYSLSRQEKPKEIKEEISLNIKAEKKKTPNSAGNKTIIISANALGDASQK